MADKSEAPTLVVVKKFAAVTKRELFKVRGDDGPWHTTAQDAVNSYVKCKAYWEKYHSNGGKKQC